MLKKYCENKNIKVNVISISEKSITKIERIEKIKTLSTKLSPEDRKTLEEIIDKI